MLTQVSLLVSFILVHLAVSTLIPDEFLDGVGVTLLISDKVKKINTLHLTLPSSGTDPFKGDQNKSTVMHSRSLQSNSFSCEQLPSAYDPYTYCSGVVDYDFLVPYGSTKSDLNSIAVQSAEQFITFINASCLNDVKRYICSQVYLKCAPGVSAGDPSTYQQTIVDPSYPSYTIPLPYLRPCINMCQSVSYMGTTCGGLLEVLGYPIDCAARDNNGIPIFDATNDVSQCNDFSTTQGISFVGEQKEPYIGELCKDIIFEYFPSTTDPLIAPHQPSYVLQNIAEITVSTIQKEVPNFYFENCLVALRQYLCGPMFLKPYADDSLASIFGTVYLPSFPEQKVCQDFQSYCGDLISSGFPTPNCSATTDIKDIDVQIFPGDAQVVAIFPLPTGNLPMMTYPNNVTDTSPENIETECPYPFDIIDNLEKTLKNGGMIPGTACGLRCGNGGLVPEDEERRFLWIWHFFYYVRLTIFFLLAFNVYITPPKKRNSFILKILYWDVLSLGVILFEPIANPGKLWTMCSSDTSWYTLDDHTTGGIFCTIAAIRTTLQYTVIPVIFYMLGIETFARVILGMKDFNNYATYIMVSLLVISYTPNILMFSGYFGTFVTSSPERGAPTCAFYVQDQTDFSVDKWMLANPLSISIGVTSLLMTISIGYIIRTSARVATNFYELITKFWKNYNFLIVFYFCMVIICLPMIVIYEIMISYVIKDRSRLTEAYGCMFQNFKTSSDTSYTEICGDGYTSDNIVVVYLYYLYGVQPICMALSLYYLSFYPEVKKWWWNYFIKVATATGLIKILKTCLTTDEGLSFVAKLKTTKDVSTIASSHMVSSNVSENTSYFDTEEQKVTNEEDDTTSQKGQAISPGFGALLNGYSVGMVKTILSGKYQPANKICPDDETEKDDAPPLPTRENSVDDIGR